MLFAAALCLALAFALGACTQAETTGGASASEPMAIGEAQEGAYAISLSNSSGKSVVSMAVKLPGEDGFSANMMSSDAHLKDGESATVYVPKSGTASTGGGYAVDVKVVFGDGGMSVLHHLDLEEFDSATLLLDGKIGYVTYQGKTANRMVSTLELQTYYYNAEDPSAAARDKAEEEEEKRRLEKLEEDLKANDEELAAANSSAKDGTAQAADPNAQTTVTTDDTQGLDIEDDPIEVSHDADASDD